MITGRKLHIMDVKSIKVVAKRIEMHGVVNEPDVFFNLRVPGIVPIDD